MENISTQVVHQCITVFGGREDLNLVRSKLHLVGDKRLFRFVFRKGSASSCSDSSRIITNGPRLSRLNLRRSCSSRTISSVKSYKNLSPSETYNSYVLDGKDRENTVTDSGDSIPKISIPGLPEEDDNDNVACPITSCFWEWKPKLTAHYEKSGSENVHSPPILFLPGFGVGSFHYRKQLKDLGRDFRAYALDFLGQGKSLPSEDPTFWSEEGNKHALDDGNSSLWGFGDENETWAEGLVFSMDLWKDQVRYFIEEVIQEPVYLVGNSLGGFVALYFAACYPNLVKGVTLLNATPFWGFLPNPQKSPQLSKFFPWAGTFPVPSRVRKLIEILWEKISDPKSIAEILKQVYADHSTKVDDLYSRIVETTQHPAAAASFASIIFAPRGQLSFKEALSRCQTNNTPICLMYGKDDPWVRPIWGLQVKRQLPDAPYYDISPAGHCPHDEVPEVVNFLLRGWIKSLESDGSVLLPLLDNSENSKTDDVINDLEFTRDGSKKSVRVQFHGSEFSFWRWVGTNLRHLRRRKISAKTAHERR